MAPEDNNPLCIFHPPILPSFAVTLPLNVPAVALIVPFKYTLSEYNPYPLS
jgi:hypothetical protein